MCRVHPARTCPCRVSDTGHHFAFANTLSKEDSDAAWEKYVIDAPGNWVWAYGLKHWAKSPSLTEYHEFPGHSHWICAEPDWEEVADYALEWALAHARHVRAGTKGS